jgi:hypothetical protein
MMCQHVGAWVRDQQAWVCLHCGDPCGVGSATAGSLTNASMAAAPRRQRSRHPSHAADNVRADLRADAR